MINAARATIRHAVFQPEDVYEYNGTRYVKLHAVWQSKRRFKLEISLEDFYQTLLNVRNADRGMMFLFWGDGEPRIHDKIWVACPHRDRPQPVFARPPPEPLLNPQ